MQTMKPKFHVILSDCVERGARRGYARAHKHVESPSEEAIILEIENCVMGEIYDYFSFDDEFAN